MEPPTQGSEQQSEEAVLKAFQDVDVSSVPALRSTQKVALKFLLSNAAAGVVIGRAGQNRNDLQQLSGARIQLSRNNEFYPGTTDRVLLLTGTLLGNITALYHILGKLWCTEDTPSSPDYPGRSSSFQVKMVLPAAVCGIIIGKGGATVKALSEESGASISISPQDRTRGLDYERILTITGAQEQLLRAVTMISAKVSESPYYLNHHMTASPAAQHVQQPAIYTQQGAALMLQQQQQLQSTQLALQSLTLGSPGGLSYQQAQPRQVMFPQVQQLVQLPAHLSLPATPAYVQAPQQQQAQQLQPRVEAVIDIPERLVGAVIGRGGETINGLKRLLNVRIMVLDNDYDTIPGMRKVQFQGAAESVQMAQSIVAQKLQQLGFSVHGPMAANANVHLGLLG